MLHTEKVVESIEEKYIKDYIEYKKSLINKISIMLNMAKQENLSPNVIESLQEELAVHSPLNVTKEELDELLLEEYENNQLHDETYNKGYSSSYKYREYLANGRVNIWR